MIKSFTSLHFPNVLAPKKLVCFLLLHHCCYFIWFIVPLRAENVQISCRKNLHGRGIVGREAISHFHTKAFRLVQGISSFEHLSDLWLAVATPVPLFDQSEKYWMFRKCLLKKNNVLPITVFENHRKSHIQHCERSELRPQFEWIKVN